MNRQLEIRSFEPVDEEAVVKLWVECGLVVPWNDPHRDIHRKLKVQPEMFLVGSLDGEIVATVMAGYDGHRGWINYLAVAPRYQRTGFGRSLMDEAEMLLGEAGCPKINLQVRTSNRDVIRFYQSLGYDLDDVVSLGKRLVLD